jgi:hypothetical protein
MNMNTAKKLSVLFQVGRHGELYITFEVPIPGSLAFFESIGLQLQPFGIDATPHVWFYVSA